MLIFPFVIFVLALLLLKGFFTWILGFILENKVMTTISGGGGYYYINLIEEFFPVYLMIFIISLFFNLKREILINQLFAFFSLSVISIFLSWRAPKYILFIIPSFIFIFSYLIFTAPLILKKRTFSFFLIFLLVLSNVSLIYSNCYLNNREFGMYHERYNLEFLKETINNKTIIITTNQFLVYDFLKNNHIFIPKENIFWLRRKSALEPDYVINSKDYWVGYQWIENLSGEDLLGEEVIIIGDRRLFSLTYVDSDTQSYIKDNFKTVYSSDRIVVFDSLTSS
jgi:hypothetical protein